MQIVDFSSVEVVAEIKKMLSIWTDQNYLHGWMPPDVTKKSFKMQLNRTVLDDASS